MSYPRLKNAPIAEAVIDFRFLPALNVDFEQMGSIHSHILADYTVKQETKNIQLGFIVGPENTTEQTVSESIIGYRFENPEKKYVFVVNKNGFSLSKLAPYEDWDVFISEAKRISEVYFGVLEHQHIVRTALRYVNQIEIVGDYIDFDDYLVAGPKVPLGLPEGLSEFFMRNVIPCHDKKASVTIIQAFTDQGNPKKADIILDIDVVCGEDYDSASGHQWDILDILRGLKNNAFFKSLHPKALELFK